MTSRDRVKTLLRGELPDRPPLYDVIRNDAVIEHFGGEKLTRDNARSVVVRAHSQALDATKSFYRLPNFDLGTTATGTGETLQRWTVWKHVVTYSSSEKYVRTKKMLTAEPWTWTAEDRRALDISGDEWSMLQRTAGDICMDFGFPGPPRLDGMFSEIGLEAFSYYMIDCPDIIHRQGAASKLPCASRDGS